MPFSINFVPKFRRVHFSVVSLGRSCYDIFILRRQWADGWEDTTWNKAVYAFRVEGKPVTCERYGFGHINKTYRIVTSWGNMYELQKSTGMYLPTYRI